MELLQLIASAHAACCCCLLLVPAAVGDLEKFRILATLAVLHWGQKNHAATHASNAFSQ
jgi:hypothetical protein